MRFILVLLLSLGYSQSYVHDFWNTHPRSIIQDYEAFRTSFFGSNDLKRLQTDFYWKVPLWVSYQIKRTTNLVSNYSRPSTWTTDLNLFRQGIAPMDKAYLNSGYDRGHLCMKEIASRIGPNADRQTHTMLNAVPQLHGFNAGIWLDLEKRSMEWADTYGDVWVICGPAFSNRKPTRFIGNYATGRIAVPDWCFKVIIKTNPSLSALAFMYPSTATNYGQYVHSNYATSLHEIFKATGLHILCGVTNWDPYQTVTVLWK